MATSISAKRWLGLLIFGLVLFLAHAQDKSVCKFHPSYVGDWYSREAGQDIFSKVEVNSWTRLTTKLICLELKEHKLEADGVEGLNTTMLVKDVSTSTDCFICMDVLWRTKNILQYRTSGCLTQKIKFENMCPGYNSLPKPDEVTTLFRRTLKKVNCISTLEGVYQFTYEVKKGGGGICDNQDNIIQACQNPGSAYVDNVIFTMDYAQCPGVQTSENQNVRYQCMGSWFAKLGDEGYTFAAVADVVEKDSREKFKCLMTRKDQKNQFNEVRWGMSRFADCDSLNSLDDSPMKLVLRKIAPRISFTAPQCNLPRNISGQWFTQGREFTSKVYINDTHIRYKTQKNAFDFEETYLSCQQSLGTRYLMTKYIEGKCEVDFVCYDIVPRHHGIVRYRTGKPARLMPNEIDDEYLTKKFREVCSWTSFTFNRDDTDWKYHVLILDPPSPVPCPLGGRYKFTQKANGTLEEYSTRIRGVTIRPRVQVSCRIVTSEFKSCAQDMSRIEIDDEYCESVDYRGRPIGEYDEPDHILTCVGFWMEDMKSYLITYDEEDAISRFRCWVYERISWTEVTMSRSQTARCQRDQIASSWKLEGTGLNLVLEENERLFDDCPQRFDPGINPYTKARVIYVLSGAPHLRLPPSVLVLLEVVLHLVKRV